MTKTGYFELNVLSCTNLHFDNLIPDTKLNPRNHNIDWDKTWVCFFLSYYSNILLWVFKMQNCSDGVEA